MSVRALRLPVLVALAALALPATAAADEQPPASEQVIVRHRAGLTAPERVELRADAGTELDHALSLTNVEVLDVTEGTRTAALRELRADPDVLWAEPNGIVHAQTTDPAWSYQWALRNVGTTFDADIDADEAWTVTRGSGVTVAVVDTGAQLDHPDLQGRLTSGYDFVNHDANPTDDNGHGTHVTGTIVAARNTVGVVGVAPEAQVMPLKALNASGSGTNADVASAFDYAGDAGVKVVNASLGSSTDSPAIEQAIADHPNTLYVVAAGNGGTDGIGDNVDGGSPTYPCASAAANVLCVGATDDNDVRASFSNYGTTSVDLFAPGVDIVSTWKGSSYVWADGTSMATPHVAGVAALVAAQDPSAGSAAIKARILATVDPVAALAAKSVSGGRLNAGRAVGASQDPDGLPPAQLSAVSATGGVNSAVVSWPASGDANLAGYRVWRYSGSWQLQADVGTGTTSLTVPDLAAGTASFAVTAYDTWDNDSDLSPVATASVQAPATAPPVSTTPPTSTTPTTPTTPTTAPEVTSLRVVRSQGRVRAIVFRLSAAAQVRLGLARRTGLGYRASATRTAHMAAGTQSLPVSSRLLGVRLRHGRWLVTVRAGSSEKSVSLRIS
jgi:thermitase